MHTILDVVKVLYPGQVESGNVTFYKPDNRVLIQNWNIEGVEKPSEDYLESLLPQYEFELNLNDFQLISTNAVRAHIDSVAQSKLYDSAISCASYTTSTNPQWKSEAETFIAWRDSVLAFCYSKLEAIRNQQIPIPTIPELLASLPEIVWP